MKQADTRDEQKFNIRKSDGLTWGSPSLDVRGSHSHSAGRYELDEPNPAALQTGSWSLNLFPSFCCKGGFNRVVRSRN